MLHFNCKIPTALELRFFGNKLLNYLEMRRFVSHPKRVGLCGSVLGGFWVTCNCAWGRSGSRGSWVLHFRFSSTSAHAPTPQRLHLSTHFPTLIQSLNPHPLLLRWHNSHFIFRMQKLPLVLPNEIKSNSIVFEALEKSKFINFWHQQFY